MLDIITVQVGVIEENCYIIYKRKEDGVMPARNGLGTATEGAETVSGSGGSAGDDYGSCVLIDPGDQPGKIRKELEAMGLTPEAILLTHAHFDHIGAVAGIRAAYPDIPIYAYEEERIIIETPAYSAGGPGRKPNQWAKDVTYLKDRTELTLLGEKWLLLATPGHTAGSCCYYVENAGYLFSGDTLFAGSCGRTDFPTGSMRSIVDSIQRVLMALPDETMVFPGHMGNTYIGAERRYNFIMRM